MCMHRTGAGLGRCFHSFHTSSRTQSEGLANIPFPSLLESFLDANARYFASTIGVAVALIDAIFRVSKKKKSCLVSSTIIAIRSTRISYTAYQRSSISRQNKELPEAKTSVLASAADTLGTDEQQAAASIYRFLKDKDNYACVTGKS